MRMYTGCECDGVPYMAPVGNTHSGCAWSQPATPAGVLRSTNLQLLKSHLRVEARGAQHLVVKRSAVPSLVYSFKLQRLLLARLLR